MGKVVIAIVGIIGVIIVFYLFPSLTDSNKDLRTDAKTDVFGSVATGVGVTNTSVTLTEALFKDRSSEITTLSSDNGTDAPLFESYVSASKALYVKGLTANTSRNLTVTYNYDALTEYDGMSEMTGLAPLLIFLGFMAVIIGLIWTAVVKGRH